MAIILKRLHVGLHLLSSFRPALGHLTTRVSAENVGSTSDVLSVTSRLPPPRVYYVRAPPPQQEAVS